jgi:acetyl esterase
VITAGYDPLRDEGRAFAKRLSDAGGEVVSRHYSDQIHGFAFMAGVTPKSKEALADIAGLVRDGLIRTSHD